MRTNRFVDVDQSQPAVLTVRQSNPGMKVRLPSAAHTSGPLRPCLIVGSIPLQRAFGSVVAATENSLGLVSGARGFEVSRHRACA